MSAEEAIDGAKTNMVRVRGRCERGTRLIDTTPHGHWKTSTFIAALRKDGLVAPAVFDGAINGELFLCYVEQVLVPTLQPDDIVVMDNCLPTKSPLGARPSRPPAQLSSSCLPIALISSLSSRCSQS